MSAAELIARPRYVARDVTDMVDALRAIKAELGLSNAVIDTLCGWVEGHCDKLLGPSAIKGFGAKTFNDLLWVLACKVEITIDPDRLREMEQHYEQRVAAQVKRPNRVSKVLLDRTRPLIFKAAASNGGRRRAECLPAKQRSQIARKAAQARWRKRAGTLPLAR